jgi:LuxR family maltose regulon positive regulatory protein
MPSGRLVAWLTLDEKDNDPLRFLNYIIAALQLIDKEIGEGVLTMSVGHKVSSYEPLVTMLINDITALNDVILLVLDDYQVIQSSQIHELLVFLLDHQPTNMHLVIGTRADPPLGLPKLRARNQINEFREGDLRFTNEEAEQFLNQVMGYSLSREDIQMLERKTEGWIAGLQFAALSLKDQADIHTFISTFEGSHKYIIDYLGEEVVNFQPAKVQDFLLHTAILDQLTGSLCNAITGGSDGQDTLEELERNHLFIIPMDHERHWYRYHRLFSDFLRKQLHNKAPELESELHVHASEWFEEYGYPDLAIDHALSAEDYPRAKRLVESVGESVFVSSEVGRLSLWLEALPEELILSSPALCFYHTWTLLLTGQPVERIESRVKAAEAADTDGDFVGEISALRSMLSAIQGDFKTSFEATEKAQAVLPENHYLRSVLADNLGMVHLLNNDVDAAIDSFEQAVELSQRTGNLMISIGALCNVAGLWMIRGQLRKANELYERALRMATNHRGRLLPVAGKAMLGLGEIWREWNDLDKAANYLTQGIDLMHQYGEIGTIMGCLTLGRVKLAGGDLDAAQALADQAQDIAVRFDATMIDDVIVSTFQAQIWIVQGRLEEVRDWVEEVESKRNAAVEPERLEQIPKRPLGQLQIIEYLTLARMYVALGREEDALDVLESIRLSTEDYGHIQTLIRILVLKSVAYHKLRQVDQAIEALQRALTLGEPEGYTRVFIDEGEPMSRLLYTAAAQGINPEYTGRLLSSLSDELVAPIPPERASSPGGELIEPLSDRELEVLELIAQGLSNQEVASNLYISLSTVKGHTGNIYGKLGVKNRTQAVAKARSLGLLSDV